MAERVTEGMLEHLNKVAPNIKFEDKRELGSAIDLKNTVAAWQSNKQGMVIFRSNGAKWLSKNPLFSQPLLGLTPTLES